MSKKMLWGATLPGCFVLAFVWAMLALSGNSLANPPDGDGNHNHGGGGGGGGNIAVTVTFQDLPDDGLMSDCFDCPDTCECLSPYIDDVDNVGAGISTRGNFRLTLTKGNQLAIRTLFYDFSDCASPGECFPPFQNGFSVRGANVVTSGSGIDLLEMFVGEVRDDLRLILMLDLDTVENGQWQIFFDPSNADCSDSTFVTVERISVDSWEIEAGLDDVACLKEQAGGGEMIFSGLYHMPFKFTIKIK